ncbi:DUF3566 domain-containing protein [Promicromonospora soli]|uniref:DUF3566 domain-containing protein n=1 Tax=Promicromonospora soli TaxID=2035533 RepID=A0A919KSY8_9MICO|nr:DUF3566 domain-containing protein [Promicromonospora soli]GHH70841.1 hypothetical protein GCM10017772_18110 [Promicromonospora soli]
MTSDKSGPVRTAPPALEEDLEITRDRKDLTEDKAPAETPEAASVETGSDKSSGSNGSAKANQANPGTGSTGEASTPAAAKSGEKLSEPIVVASPSPSVKVVEAKPETKAPAPTTPRDSGTDIPTTGGVWRSAYEAGRAGKESKPAQPETAANDEAKTPPGLVSAIGRVSEKTDAPTPQSATVPEPDAKSWNRVPAPDAPAPAGAADGVKAGAMKAAQAALDVARSAAKKVSSIMPDDDAQTVPAPSEPQPRPEMHYTAGGVRGTATPTGAPAAPGPQAPTHPASTPTPEVPRPAPAPAGPRRVRLAISRVDPWSVMKLAFLLAVAIAIMTVVATAVFWSVLDGFGVFTTVQSFVEDAVGPQSNVNLTQFVEFPRVISLATLISICNIVLLTAIATIMAFLYNITAALVGGVHMTLTDD